jgi:hypothetical protein
VGVIPSFDPADVGGGWGGGEGGGAWYPECSMIDRQPSHLFDSPPSFRGCLSWQDSMNHRCVHHGLYSLIIAIVYTLHEDIFHGRKEKNMERMTSIKLLLLIHYCMFVFAVSTKHGCLSLLYSMICSSYIQYAVCRVSICKQ